MVNTCRPCETGCFGQVGAEQFYPAAWVIMCSILSALGESRQVVETPFCYDGDQLIRVTVYLNGVQESVSWTNALGEAVATPANAGLLSAGTCP